MDLINYDSSNNIDGYQMNSNYIKIYTPRRTLWIAHMLKKTLMKNNIKSIITRDIQFDDDLLYILLCCQQIKLFPKKYMVYQLEQVMKSDYFNISYINAINDSIYTFDYSLLNIRNLINEYGVNKNKLVHLPIPVETNIITAEHSYDIIFYGTLNDRRRAIINKLQTRYSVLIITNKFGNELLDEIKKGKIIVNLHYFKSAILETARLNESLQFQNIIISEFPDDNDPNKHAYDEHIYFINEISDDLSNIDELFCCIDTCLKQINNVDITTARKNFVNKLCANYDTNVLNMYKCINNIFFMQKLGIKSEYVQMFYNLENFINMYYPNDWNYTKIMKNLTSNSNEMFNYFCFNEQYNSNIQLTHIIKANQPYEAVLICFDYVPHIEFIIKNNISKLSEKWSHTIVTNNEQYQFIQNICDKISPSINIVLLDDLNYCNTIVNLDFWKLLTGDYILLYNQNNYISHDIPDKFYEYGYVGCSTFSLRKKHDIINVLNVHNYDDYLKKINRNISTNQLKSMGNNKTKIKIVENIIKAEKKKLNEKYFFMTNMTNYNFANDNNCSLFMNCADTTTNRNFSKLCNVEWNNNKKFCKSMSDVNMSDVNMSDVNISDVSDASDTSDIYVKYDHNGNRCILNNTNYLTNISDFGFIMLRHVDSITCDQYWKECYSCIRKYYDDIIVIIDDNSNVDCIDDAFEMINVIVITSEFGYPHGEILPYYYYYSLHLFDKALILHDSMFINKYIDYRNQQEKFIWHFNGLYEDYAYEQLLLSKLDHSVELLALHKNLKEWKGCFGCCGIVNYVTVKHFNDKYKLFNILDHIYTRSHRSCFERIIALLYHHSKIVNDSLNGSIWQFKGNFKFGYDDYKNNKYIEHENYNIIKIWTGR
jgi:hypothetical protein